MNKKSFILVVFILSSFFNPNILFAQNKAATQVQLSNFDLQSSAVISQTGEALSNPAYQSNVYWFPVKVPALTA